MDFAASLARAIAAENRSAVIRAAVITLGCAALQAGVWVGTGRPFGIIPAVVIVGVGWVIARKGTPTAQALKKLRGGQPEQWLPSTSHALVVVTGEQLIVGGVRSAELNRHAMSRVTSISFDEEAHTLTVDLTTTVQTRNGEREQLERHLVKLRPDVPPQRAFGFAKHVLALSQR